MSTLHVYIRFKDKLAILSVSAIRRLPAIGIDAECGVVSRYGISNTADTISAPPFSYTSNFFFLLCSTFSSPSITLVFTPPRLWPFG